MSTGSHVHPCPYPPVVLAAMRRHLAATTGLLVDPMAGSGAAYLLSRPDLEVIGVDLEPWNTAPGATVLMGNSLYLRNVIAGHQHRTRNGQLRWTRRYGLTLTGYTYDVPPTPDLARWQAVAVSPGYGNRLRDRLRTDRTADTVLTYAQRQGRNLQHGNGCALPFDDRYRDLHRAVWTEAIEGLDRGGRFLLNAKDHYRTREATKTRTKTQDRQRVTAWHITTLLDLGLDLEAIERLPVNGFTRGRNATARLDHETLAVFTKP